jgi:hypothetical protein
MMRAKFVCVWYHFYRGRALKWWFAVNRFGYSKGWGSFEDNCGELLGARAIPVDWCFAIKESFL